MRKLLAGIFVILSLNSYSQYDWDYGVSLGLTNYMGDIGGPAADPIKVQMARTNAGAGFYLRYKLSNLVSIKGSLNYLRISGADSLSESPGRLIRNLHFRNALYEFSVVPEFHFYQTKDFGRTGRYKTFLNAYLFGGVGVAFHNPQAQLNGKWVDLQPLQTEGVNYSTVVPVFPIGIGSHFTFNRRVRLGVEAGVRMTFFDYFDDVSDQYLSDAELAEVNGSEEFIQLQNRIDIVYIRDHPELFPVGYREGGNGKGGVRGNPDSKDWYFYTGVTFGYVIKGSSNFYRSRYSYSRGRKKKRRRSRAKF